MSALFGAHSGLRYLVLLAGFAAEIVFALGLVQKTPFSKQARIVGSVFAGLLDLQILLGTILVAMGLYTPKAIGHIVMMVVATTVTHATFIRNRKQATPGYLLPLIGVSGAMALIIGGIFALGRLPWAMTAYSGT